MVPQFLQRLELDLAVDERAIRRAYARELKKIDQEADPTGFQTLREAYDAALSWVKRTERPTFVSNAEATDLVVRAAPTDPSPAPSDMAQKMKAERASPNTQAGADDAMMQATTAFVRFMEAFHTAPLTVEPNVDAELWQARLEKLLAGDELISMAVRDLFEHKFAHVLTQGWKPGHEVLLVVASKVFRWNEDRHSLRRLGHTGFILERALQERALFDRLRPKEYIAQRTLIARLRDPAEPSVRELNSSFADIERIAKNFPTWLGMVTDVSRIANWRELYSQIPKKKSKAAVVRLSPGAIMPASSTSKWWLVVVVLGMFAIMTNFLDKRPAPQSVFDSRQVPAHSEIPGPNVSLPAQEISSGTQAPVDPRGGRPIPPPLSQKAIAVLVNRTPTDEVCSKVSDVAYRYGVGTDQQDADLGPAFDRQIIACVGKKHWPRSRVSDAAVRQVLDRERVRLEKETKKVWRDLNNLPLTVKKSDPQPETRKSDEQPSSIQLWTGDVAKPAVIGVPKSEPGSTENYPQQSVIQLWRGNVDKYGNRRNPEN